MQPFIKDQLTTDLLVLDLLYTIGAVSVLFVVLALGFIDTALARAKNALDTWVLKLTASLIAGASTLFVGFGIWNWQFNKAFGVPDPLWQAIKDWSIFGKFQTSYAGELSPDVLVEADVQQVFLVFFVTFSIAAIALIHSGVTERMKARPLFVMAVVVGIVSPLVAYFVWGPVGPLSNEGTHDLEGVFPLYIFAGTWAAVLSWRVGPRLGAFEPHPSGTAPRGSNIGLAAGGVVLILIALPFIALASTWIFPEVGIFGIAFSSTGWGIILINVFASYIGGAISGGVIAYWRKEPVWALLGPLAGAIVCGTLFDVGVPWEVFLVSLAGPPVALGTAALARRLRIDDPKVVPLALGPGVVGALITGFVEWGTPTGGFLGLEGDYAPGHAEITPWWQLAGVALTMTLSAIPCLLICLLFEKTSGLRVSEEEELAGLDHTYWGIENYRLETMDVQSSVMAGAGAPPERTVGST